MDPLESRRFHLMLGGFTLLAAVLRLLWLDQATFGFDQAQLSLRALAMARAGQFAWTGVSSSIGVPNLPVTVWFFALLYRLTTDPLWGTGAVALLNAASVYGLGALARRAWGVTAGILAAALYALSPWAILFSRSIWAQDLLAPLAIVWAYAGFSALTSRRGTRWAAVCVLCAGLAPQVHYAGVVLWPATLWMAVKARWWGRGRWPGLAAGAGVAMLSAAPFVWAMWPGRGELLTLLAESGRAWRADLSVVGQMFALGSGLEWPVVAWGEGAGLDPALLDVQRAASWVLAATLLGGVAALAIVILRHGRSPGRDGHGRTLSSLTLIWLTGPLLAFTLHSAPVYHHYLLAALPALPLAITFAVTGLCASRGSARGLRRVLGALVLLAATLQAGLWVAGTAPAAATRSAGRTSLATQRAVLAALPPDGPVVLATDCDAHEVCEDAAVWEVRLWRREHRIVDGRHALLLPGQDEDPGATLLLSPSGGALFDSWGHGAARLAEVGHFRLSRVGPGWIESLTRWERVAPSTLSTGASLQAWSVERAGDTLRLWTLWRIVGPVAPGQWQQFNHLYAGTDKIAGQDYAVSSRAWRTGDWLITWADLPAPPDDAALAFEVGMYDLATMERAAILERPDDAGRAVRLEAP